LLIHAVPPRMKKNGTKRLTHKTLAELRKRVVTRVQGRQSPEIVAQAFGINQVTIYGWLSRYHRGGWDALDDSKRGGRSPKVDAKAMRWIYKTITRGIPCE